MNSGAGGLNPEVVEVAAKAGAKVIWMPTYSSVVDSKKPREKREDPAHQRSQTAWVSFSGRIEQFVTPSPIHSGNH